jgi:ABC-type phosphate transport system auxiliary subunit
MTDKLQALVAHDKAQKALIASQAAEIERLGLILKQTQDDHDSTTRTLSAEIERLKEQLKQTQLGGALRDDYNEKRLNATIASQAAEIAELKEREIMRLVGISTASRRYF